MCEAKPDARLALEGSGVQRAATPVRTKRKSNPGCLWVPEVKRGCLFLLGAFGGCLLPTAQAGPPVSGAVKPMTEAARLTPVAIAAGPYWMGRNNGRKNERPRHLVALDAFEIDRTEVTVSDYQACVDAQKCGKTKKAPACTGQDKSKALHPINCVSWKQARQYCRFRKKRLPTEAEWERAARGKDERRFVWGPNWPPPTGAGNFADRMAQERNPHWRVLNDYADGYAATAPVGTFAYDRTEVGAVDMGGNVMEWTQDYYRSNAYSKHAKANPRGPKRGRFRVVRGASYGQSKKASLELTRREFYREESMSVHIGFRCARTLP